MSPEDHLLLDGAPYHSVSLLSLIKKRLKKKKKYVQRLDTGIFMVLLQPTCFCISRSKQRYSVGAASASGS